MKKIIYLIALVAVVSGCSSIGEALNSQKYRHGLLELEIEKAYEDGEITKKEYFELKLRNERNLNNNSVAVSLESK